MVNFPVPSQLLSLSRFLLCSRRRLEYLIPPQHSIFPFRSIIPILSHSASAFFATLHFFLHISFELLAVLLRTYSTCTIPDNTFITTMFSTKLWSAAILACFVAGQFNSSSFTIPSSVDLSQKGMSDAPCLVHDRRAPVSLESTTMIGSDLSPLGQWCIAERNACPLLCGGPDFYKANRCIGVCVPIMFFLGKRCLTPMPYPQRELPKFDCICNNGTAPANIEAYVGSVPNSICVATFEQCRRENPGSEDCPVCGTLSPDDVPKGVVSSTASSTPTATATVTVDTASAASVTPTGTPGAAAPLAGGFSGGLVMGAMAALGLLW